MSCTPSIEEVRDRLACEGRVPIYRELLADLDTPVSAYLKVAGSGRGFLLESVENGERSARYSFLGGGPRATLTFQDGLARLDRDGHSSQQWACKDPLDALRRLIGTPRQRSDNLPPFCGGAVGYLGYEVAACFEHLPVGDDVPPVVPDALFMLADPIVVFDHVLRTVKVLSTVALDDGASVDEAYTAAETRIDDVCTQLRPADRSAKASARSQGRASGAGEQRRPGTPRAVGAASDRLHPCRRRHPGCPVPATRAADGCRRLHALSSPPHG